MPGPQDRLPSARRDRRNPLLQEGEAPSKPSLRDAREVVEPPDRKRRSVAPTRTSIQIQGYELSPDDFNEILDYEKRRIKFLKLLQTNGFGVRVKQPRHLHALSAIALHFSDCRTVFDFGTLGGANFLKLLVGNAAGSNKKHVGPFSHVHGTHWNFTKINKPFVEFIDKAPRDIDINCFECGHESLSMFKDEDYDLVLALNVINHLVTWDDVREARDQLCRIARVGCLFSVATDPLYKIAMNVRMRNLQNLGFDSEEWDKFFAEIGAIRIDEWHFVWMRDAGRYDVVLQKEKEEKARQQSERDAQRERDRKSARRDRRSERVVDEEEDSADSISEDAAQDAGRYLEGPRRRKPGWKGPLG